MSEIGADSVARYLLFLPRMATFEIRLDAEIEATPGRVWAQLVDRGALPGWCEGVRSVAIDEDRLLVLMAATDGPERIGGRILRVDPRRRLEFVLEDPASNVRRARVAIELEGQGERTRATVRVQGWPGLFGGLMLPLLRLRAEVLVTRGLRGFRARLDRRTGREDRSIRPTPPLPAAETARLVATASF